MDAKMYHRMLSTQVKPSLNLLFPQADGVFQQDNDPKHTAKINKRYLVNQGINTMVWPSQSPDLNPIENLWSILDDKLKFRNCQNEEQLFDALKRGWEALDPVLLTSLVDSMPRRCQAVIDSKGYATKY